MQRRSWSIASDFFFYKRIKRSRSVYSQLAYTQCRYVSSERCYLPAWCCYTGPTCLTRIAPLGFLKGFLQIDTSSECRPHFLLHMHCSLQSHVNIWHACKSECMDPNTHCLHSDPCTCSHMHVKFCPTASIFIGCLRAAQGGCKCNSKCSMHAEQVSTPIWMKTWALKNLCIRNIAVKATWKYPLQQYTVSATQTKRQLWAFPSTAPEPLTA